ncbi:hypothetical protein Acr_09g0004790 [Actinidia rufa]|uniref:Uncharacterized protein n=1 Tax=Actinidia rufa TaxID=165716 RepID=A0A7J0F5Z8_9ERIC|nr:hypothetical protein Acr_09g0004790 [Actinidia rufa]
MADREALFRAATKKNEKQYEIQSINKKDVLYADVRVNGQPSRALIDMGATHNFISSEEAKRLGLKSHICGMESNPKGECISSNAAEREQRGKGKDAIEEVATSDETNLGPGDVEVLAVMGRERERGYYCGFGAGGGGGRQRGPTAERELQRGEGFGSSEAAKHGGESTPPREAPGIQPSPPRPPAEFEELRVVFHLSICM